MDWEVEREREKWMIFKFCVWPQSGIGEHTGGTATYIPHPPIFHLLNNICTIDYIFAVIRLPE